MNGLITFVLEQINMGLMTGIVVGLLMLSYPLLKRIFTAQQRVVLWVLSCMGTRFVHLLESSATLYEVSFQDLVVPRTGRYLRSTPAFLPGEYNGPGDYHLALPGGALIRVELQEWLMLLMAAVWFAGAIALIVHFWRSSRRLLQVGRRGELLQEGDPRRSGMELNAFFSESTKVYISPGLPTSFVSCKLPTGLEYEIFVQKELPPEQMELVLLHESRHIQLFHAYWKLLATFTLVLNWWNPLVWLGFKYFCRDVEQACDDSVMKKLSPERRKEYAKTLVELGAGRQLWEAPLTFGECDAVLRVKRLVKWRKRHWLLSIPLWIGVLALAFFLDGGHSKLQPAEDMVLAWEREKGGVEAFVQDLELAMAEEIIYHSDEQYPSQPQLEQARQSVADRLWVTGVWEAPVTSRKNSFSGEDTAVSALWVRNGTDQWYRVIYVWWAGDSDWIGVFDVEEVSKPDLTDCRQLA